MTIVSGVVHINSLYNENTSDPGKEREIHALTKDKTKFHFIIFKISSILTGNNLW